MIRIGAGIFVLVMAAVLNCGTWADPLERRLRDAQFRWLRALAPQEAADEVVVIGFNEETTAILREPLPLWHHHLGKVLHAVAAAGAAVIGVDVVLPDRSVESLLAGYDKALLAGLLSARRSTSVVLALTVDAQGKTRPIYPPFIAAAGEAAAAYALLPLDGDGTVRRFDERIERDGNSVATLAGEMARRMGRRVGTGLIDYAKGSAFSYIPLQTVLAWADAGQATKLHSAFSGKAVLLGGVFKYEDRLDAPVHLLAWDMHSFTAPGVILHAQILRNFLNQGLIRPAAAWLPLSLSMLAALLWWWPARPLAAMTLLSAVVAALTVASTVALAHGVALPVVVAVVLAVCATAGRQLLEAGFKLRERRQLRRVFAGYVSPAVMSAILAGKLDAPQGGVTCFACVLFSDIRGYTRLSESMGPEKSVEFLNSYFERIVPIIHGHGGTVISFMGDGIMAVFGVPNALPNPCQAAYAAALSMLDDRRQLNLAITARGDPPLHIGIGLHCGEGVAGHIGAVSRHEYSLIGDVTNVASRLEAMTKELGCELVCSRAVADRLDAAQPLAALGPRAMRGHSAVEVFGLRPQAAATDLRPLGEHAL